MTTVSGYYDLECQVRQLKQEARSYDGLSHFSKKQTELITEQVGEIKQLNQELIKSENMFNLCNTRREQLKSKLDNIEKVLNDDESNMGITDNLIFKINEILSSLN